jgi:uncharacterized membrane protein
MRVADDPMKKILVTIAILALAGVAVSAYALWQHYAPLGAAFCNLNESFSCDLVNKSAYSEFLGIPVAGIGIAGYVVLGVLATAALVRPEWLSAALPWLLAASLGGLGFSMYLTYLELFVIGAICVLCVTSQALILGITGSTAVAYRSERNQIHDTVPPPL